MASKSDDLGPFSAEESVEIIRAAGLAGDDDIILVGGQAVAFWASRLEREYPELHEFALLASKDLDFLGRAAAVEEAADRIGAKVRYPPPEQVNTPEFAVVTGKWNGKNLRIDFLGSLIRLSNIDVRKDAVAITHRSSGVSIRVMHPLHVFESRLANVVGPPGRKDLLALDQLRAAGQVAFAYIEEAARQGTPSSARNATRLLMRYADVASSDDSFRVQEKHGIDLWSYVHSERLTELPAEFHAKQWPQLQAEHKRSLDKFVKIQNMRRGRINQKAKRPKE